MGKNLLGIIEKAIQTANIGVNPNNNGEVIKLFFPPMTVEQRQETAKQAKVMTDNAKVAIRNIRQNSNTKIKNLLKDKLITEDDSKKAQDEVQKITDGFVAKADETLKQKERDFNGLIMNIEQIYKDANALLEGHFKLSSGNHSQFYLQSAKVLEDQKLLNFLQKL